MNKEPFFSFPKLNNFPFKERETKVAAFFREIVGFINSGSLGDRLLRQGSVQESKYNRPEERPSRRPEGLDRKERRPLVDSLGSPLRSEHSLRPPAAYGRPLRSEGLAQSPTSDSDPASLRPGLVGTLLTALLRPAHSEPTGAIRPWTPAR